MLILKDDTIDLRAINPALVLVIVGTVVPCLASFDLDCVITSCAEHSAKHSFTSLHYSGAAVDIRTGTPGTGERWPNITAAYRLIKASLNKDFDLIDEGNHLHLEFQPKRRL